MECCGNGCGSCRCGSIIRPSSSLSRACSNPSALLRVSDEASKVLGDSGGICPEIVVSGDSSEVWNDGVDLVLGPDFDPDLDHDLDDRNDLESLVDGVCVDCGETCSRE